MLMKGADLFLLDVIVIGMANFIGEHVLLSSRKISPKTKLVKMRAESVIEMKRM
jgi:hypothetical protein